jgi:hypothetical protein
MGGGIIDLICRGVEDLWLSGDPQITMFKIAYRRYSNFYMETQNVPLTGKQAFAKQDATNMYNCGKLSGILPKIGDLVGNVYLKIKLPRLVAMYNESLIDTINELLAKYDIIIFKSDAPNILTYNSIKNRIDDKLVELNTDVNFYNKLIIEFNASETDNITVPQNLRLLKQILQLAVNSSTKEDDIYFMIYNAILEGTKSKTETFITPTSTIIVGPYDLLSPPNLDNYQVSLKNIFANKLKGETHIIMTADEIVKGFQRAIELLIFGNNPSDMKFIYKFYNTNISFIDTRGIIGSTKLINIFDKILNLTKNIFDNTATIVVTDTPVDVLVDQPFYERFSSFGFETTDYRQLDSYKFISYYLEANGGNVQTALLLRSTTIISDATIKMLITELFNKIKVLLWGIVIGHYLVDIGIFVTLADPCGSNIFLKLKNWTTAPLPNRVNNISEFSDLYSGLNLLSEFSDIAHDTEQNVLVTAVPFNQAVYDIWIRHTNYGIRDALFNNTYFQLTEQNVSITVNDFVNFIETITTTIVSQTLFPRLGPLSQTVKTPDFDPTRLLYVSNYDVLANTTLLKLKREQYNNIIAAQTVPTDQTGAYNFDLSFNSFMFSPLIISYILGLYLKDPTHPFNYDPLGDLFYSSNYYINPDPVLFAAQTSAIPLGLRIRNPEGSLVILMRYISNYILNIFNTIDPTHVDPDVNFAIDYINKNDTKLAFALMTQIFPRLDDMLPYSPTNDSYYILTQLTMNPYGSKIINTGDGFNNFLNIISEFFNWSRQIVLQFDTLIFYYAILELYIPTHMFVTEYMFNKNNQITNDKIIDIYFDNLKNIAAASVGTIVYNNGLTFIGTLESIKVKLTELKIKNKASQNDRRSLIEFSFTTPPYVPPINYSQTNPIVPDNLKIGIAYTKISNLLNMIDPNDVDTFLTTSTVISDIFSPVIFDTTNEKIDHSLESIVQSSLGLREFTNAQQKKSYNNIYKNTFLNLSLNKSTKIPNNNLLQTTIGLNTSTRMSGYFNKLLKDYNINTFNYNNTNPYIKVQYVGDVIGTDDIKSINDVNNITFVNDIDYTLFSVLPNDYTFIYPTALINTSGLFTVKKNDTFAKVIKNVIGYAGTEGTIINDINNFINLHNSYNVNYRLVDLLSVEPIPLINFFDKKETIFNYYYNIMASATNTPPFDLSPTGVIITFMNTYFNFIHNYFYTVEELYLYLKDYCMNTISMNADDLVKFNLFFNSISPHNMVNNLKTIEEENPNGFRYTNLYITFVIQQLFKNISYLKQINFNLGSNFSKLKEDYMNILNSTSLKIINLSNAKPDILNLFLYRTSSNNSTFARCSWVENIGINIIENIILKFSGQTMESLDTDSLYMLNLIDNDIGNQRAYDIMIGNVRELILFDNNPKEEYVLKVPIPFFFTKSPNTFLSYVSMLYQDIEIYLETKSIEKLIHKDINSHLVKITPSKNPNKAPIISKMDLKVEFDLSVEYIYVEKEERMNLASKPQEYLMEYIKSSDPTIIDKTSIPDDRLLIKLSFLNTCKYFFWVTQTKHSEINNNWQTYGYDDEDYIPITRQPIDYNDNKKQMLNTKILKRVTPFNYTNSLIMEKDSKFKTRKHIFSKLLIRFNGTDRVKEQDMNYYTYLQPYYHCKNDFPDGTGVYPFCIDMNNNQPTGQCNLGKIDHVDLLFTISDGMKIYINNYNEYIKTKIFYKGYNILRYYSGFAGWAFYE